LFGIASEYNNTLRAPPFRWLRRLTPLTAKSVTNPILKLPTAYAERWIELRRPRFLAGAAFVNSNPLFYDLLGDF
jgi:hypothetical protein